MRTVTVPKWDSNSLAQSITAIGVGTSVTYRVGGAAAPHGFDPEDVRRINSALERRRRSGDVMVFLARVRDTETRKPMFVRTVVGVPAMVKQRIEQLVSDLGVNEAGEVVRVRNTRP